MLKVPLFFILALALIGCSRQPGTKTSFSVELAGLGAQPGGLMVYGHDESGQVKFAHSFSSASESLTLPAGNWSFYALGWDGGSHMSGSLRCAKTTATLAGAEATVKLTVNAANCNDSSFTPSAHFDQTLRLYTCSNLVGLSAGGDCDSQPGQHGSYELRLVGEAQGLSFAPLHLTSSCFSVGPSPATLAETNVRFPLGGGLLSLRTEIHAYPTSACSGNIKEVISFPTGIAGGSNVGSVQLLDDNAGPPNFSQLFFLAPPTLPPTPLLSVLNTSPSSLAATDVQLTNIQAGAQIYLYDDAACSNELTNEPESGATSVVQVNLSNGTHQLYAKQEVAGLSSACSSGTAPHIVDLVDPLPASSLAWSGTNPSQGSAATLTWNLGSDNFAVANQLVQLHSNASCTNQVASIGLGPAANTHTFTGLTDGLYYALVINQDTSGRQGYSGCSSAIELDNVEPNNAANLTWSGSSPTNSSSIVANWDKSTSPDLAGQELIIYQGPTCDTELTVINLNNVVTNGSYTHSTDDNYSFKIRSLDYAGNPSTTGCSAAILVDTVAAAPTVALQTPASSPGNIATPTIAVSGVEVGALVTLYRDAGCTVMETSGTALGTSINIATNALLEGPHTFWARQVDPVGNVSDCSSGSVSYLYDATPPLQPTISGITGGADVTLDDILSSGGFATVNWSDLSDEAFYQISIYDNDNSDEVCAPVVQPADTTSYAFSACPLTPGAGYVARLTATDSAGNESATENFPFWLPYPAPPWSAIATNNMQGQRQHTATLAGPLMYVFGGYNGMSTLATAGYQYDTIANSWAAMPMTNGPSQRFGHSAVWTGGELLVWGGRNLASDLQTGARLMGASWNTISTASAPAARAFHIAVFDSPRNRMIVWGGKTVAADYFNDGGIYDLSTNSWTSLPSMDAPSPRAHAAYAIMGNYLVVWGGENNGVGLSDGAMYDLVNDEWIPMNLSGVPTGRFNMASTSSGTDLLVWGGTDGTNKLDDGGRYNLAEDMWYPITSNGALSSRDHATMVWSGNYAIVYAGLDQSNVIREDAAIYNPVINKWQIIGNGPGIRYHHSMIWANGKAIVFGGTDGTTILKTGGQFTP